MLPVMKDVARKIERLYKTVRCRFAIPVGKLGGQNKTHFYARFLPKYKDFYGNECVSYNYKPATPEQTEEINEALQPNQDNVIAEKSKVITKLHNKTSPGYTVIMLRKMYSRSSDDLLN